MKSLLDNTQSPGKGRLQSWVGELDQATSAPDAAQLMERGQEIWHVERDFPHTALSQLYAAPAYRTQGDSGSYRLAVIRALNLMGDHQFYRDTSIAIPLALFEQMAEEPA